MPPPAGAHLRKRRSAAVPISNVIPPSSLNQTGVTSWPAAIARTLAGTATARGARGGGTGIAGGWHVHHGVDVVGELGVIVIAIGCRRAIGGASSYVLVHVARCRDPDVPRTHRVIGRVTPNNPPLRSSTGLDSSSAHAIE